ncbi:MAG: diaminopimelate decarboxylase [Halobacteriales archaeon]|nr:diaminopimelate decarboxylase [Halobacteriales archaeon]
MTAATDTENPPIRRLAEWPRDRLRTLAADHGTPLYVLDLGRVRENARRIQAAFPDAAVHYAAKANTLRAVLRTLDGMDIGIECAAGGEIYRARNAGVAGEDITYTAVNPPERDLEYATTIDGITITVGAADTVDRLADLGYDGRFCVRVNPGVGAGHHEKVTTGSSPKFGVPYDEVGAVLDRADEYGFDIVGIHAHAGSGISGDDFSAHRKLVARMGELARSVIADGYELEFVDVGGGFGVPYRPDEPPVDLTGAAEATREALGRIDARLAVEPGRYFVADAGVLLTTVNTVKPTPSAEMIGIDAGMATLIRPAMYGSYHHVESLAPDANDRPTHEVTLAGPICETSDILGTDRPLPAPERGDVLAIGNAGAYGAEMASQYNSQPRPATVVIDGDRTAVAQRRETFEDLIEREREVDWL